MYYLSKNITLKDCIEQLSLGFGAAAPVAWSGRMWGSVNRDLTEFAVIPLQLLNDKTGIAG